MSTIFRIRALLRGLSGCSRCVAFACVIILCSLPASAQAPGEHQREANPLQQAHAHNDYLHDRPLLDALAQGFCSVEADVFLVDGDLWVAHTRAELVAEKNLRELYLEPLHKRFVKNGGKGIYESGESFTLLIDFKSNGEETYEVLDRMLEEYAEMLTRSIDGTETKGAVTAVISGDRPIERIIADRTRYAGIDGRLSDLNSDLSASLMPLISDNWNSHFRWRGTGVLTSEEREKLMGFVNQAHQQNRKIRFWATPDTSPAWQAMATAGVDLINTDDLSGLAKFLRGR